MSWLGKKSKMTLNREKIKEASVQLTPEVDMYIREAKPFGNFITKSINAFKRGNYGDVSPNTITDNDYSLHNPPVHVVGKYKFMDKVICILYSDEQKGISVWIKGQEY